MSSSVQNPEAKFHQDSAAKAFDTVHRRKIKFNIGKYNAAVLRGREQYANYELARSRAAYFKDQAVRNLDRLLLQWEEKFTARGGKVIWARDSKEALEAIIKILEKKHAKLVVKSKSMTTEEIHLNAYLEKNGITPVETDLGEWIVQLAGQRPYHIVTPAMHMSKEDVNELFVKKLQTESTNDPQELTKTARRLLREKYTTADVGISGANFLIADTGAVALTENEGNARLSVTFPKVHIAIAGIEKIIPEMEMLDTFWPLLATAGTGQTVTIYNTLLNGPRRPEETDGPEEMYVVLLDNGRSKLLADQEKREALRCIRCGACLNACPVYKNIGGHSYETTYSGPIGSVISPHYNGLEQFKHLSFASSLCGACTSVCPVRIDLANLLLQNRRQAVNQGLTTAAERTGFKLWKTAMKRRKLIDMVPAFAKSYALNSLFKDSWGRRRADIHIAPKSFHALWEKRRGKSGSDKA
ncbi:MAG: LutB/LldF family L-lactate oxidation iron-sulfur protein [Bacteroidota bacterium]